jgi:hypothetical protein
VGEVMRIWLGLILLLLAIGSAPKTAIAAPTAWRITHPEWTQADEKGFGEFIRSIAESGCSTTVECMRGPGNPFRDSDPKSLTFEADCAKWVYMLRAYYAWKNGLPFSYASGIAGRGDDFRFTGAGNRITARRDLVDRGTGLAAVPILMDIHEQVSSATYRTDAAQAGPILSDFYSPKIQPGSIRAGTVIYDINGHVAIVYAVEPDGRVRYVSAAPDMTVTRSVYGAQFGQSQAALGGGFKNFRPLKLVGAVEKNGAYVGGRIVIARDEEIPDFSLEQYRGNGPHADGDGPDANFQYQGELYGLFEYVRGSLSGGTYRFDPVYELKAGMDMLCHSLQERGKYVDIAIQAGIDKKPEPSALPGNIYASDNEEWEAYATPSRDASLKNSFSQLYVDLMKFVFRARSKNPNPAAEAALKQDLQKAYEEKARTCSITYTNSAGRPVTFGFNDAVQRLFTMSFDPYQCIERRWGATSEQELASCGDDEVKTRWYKAQQNLRNQAERVYGPRQRFTIADLEQGAPGSGPKRGPATDIAHLIANIGRGQLMAQMEPVGY